MEKNEAMKYAWVDEGKQIVSFEQIHGARLFCARETDFWNKIMGWIKKGYAIQ